MHQAQIEFGLVILLVGCEPIGGQELFVIRRRVTLGLEHGESLLAAGVALCGCAFKKLQCHSLIRFDMVASKQHHCQRILGTGIALICSSAVALGRHHQVWRAALA